jgi:signal peptidase I
MEQAKSIIKEFVEIAVLTLIIVLPIRTFIAQPFLVSGASMDNTFHNADYLIIDEISYRFHAPERGDVIIFKVPPEGLALQRVAEDKTIFYIKRIMGLPGETIQINGDQVKIYDSATSSGKVLNEPYIYIDKNIQSNFSNIKLTVTLKNDEYFVMGDNRHNSSDSRLWGVLKKANIKGRVLLRLFPFNQISVLTGEYNNY